MGRCSVLFASLMVFLGSNVFATTWTVPSGKKSIAEAVAAAANSGDTIVLTNGKYTPTDSVYKIAQTYDGNGVTITKSITIRGAGSTKTVIDLQHLGRAFKITGGTVTIRDIGFVNGYSTGPVGLPGTYGGDVTADANGQDMPSPQNSGTGGAIYVENASPTIMKCVFQDCVVAGPVGGLGVQGQDGNSAKQQGKVGGRGGDAAGDGLGGAIYIKGPASTTLIQDCNFISCVAKGGVGGDAGRGGSGYGDSGTANMGGEGGDGDGSGYGAAIYSGSGCIPQIVRCAFRNNLAMGGQGGAGGRVGYGKPATPPVADGRDGVGTGTGLGGAIYYETGSDPNILDCMFVSNAADQCGAVHMLDNSDGAITNSVFNSNTSYNFSGGAIRADASNGVTASTLRLVNCSFNSNSCAGGSFGGAIVLWSTDLTAVDTGFSSNSSDADGGAIYSDCTGVAGNKIDLTRCYFGNSRCVGNGGAISSIANSNIILNQCSFTNNTATIFGGGLFVDSPTGTVTATKTNFIGNIAVSGGGLMTANAVIAFDEVNASNNSCAGLNSYGGGYYCVSSPSGTISNSKFDLNIAQGTAYSAGGGIQFEASLVTISNCQVTNNLSGADGGGVSLMYFSDVDMSNITFSDDVGVDHGGAAYIDTMSEGSLKDSIVVNCSRYGIYDESGAGKFPITYTLFSSNAPFDLYNGSNLSGTAIASVPGNSNIIASAPGFITGPLGRYYLPAGGVCFDAGSTTAALAGVSTRTTSTDNTVDSGTVDLGYHFADASALPQYTLTLSVVGGNGTIKEEFAGPYYEGTVVNLSATPNMGYRIQQWTGTANDFSKAKSNSVVMVANKAVTVRFDQCTYWNVGGSGELIEIQNAIDNAQAGDVVLVKPGLYRGLYAYDPNTSEFIGMLMINKSITIQSEYPNDPCLTVIEAGAYANDLPAVVFGPNAGSDVVFSGFIIRNATRNYGKAADGTQEHINGWDGGNAWGGGIICETGSSPLIMNTIVTGCELKGMNGGKGYNAQTLVNAGRGGWGGFAYGAGVFIYPNAKPRFKNVVISDNIAIGGTGGNGGDSSATRSGNYGGNWTHKDFPDITPLRFEWPTQPLWQVWGYWNDFRYYSAYGAGVYCDSFSEATFENCRIENNRAEGGMSGKGGVEGGGTYREPITPYKLPTFGAGVYCSSNTKTIFRNCVIADNNAVAGDGDYTYSDYISFGGGVCCETGTTKFYNCQFSSNISQTGGGLFQSRTVSDIVDCNFSNNAALTGGGMHVDDSDIKVINTSASGNSANGAAGQGGAFSVFKSDALFADCEVIGNDASGSGGGVYLGGSNAVTKLHNCLLTDNSAGRDGGGVAVAEGSHPSIISCTLSANEARGDAIFTGGTGLGGGVSARFGADVTITNSLLWGNIAPRGSELAVFSGFDTEIGQAAVTVTYSNIKTGGTYVENTNCILNVANNLSGSSDTNPRFVEGYYLSQAPDQTLATPNKCLDAGTGGADALPLGKYRYTTSTSGAIDTGTIDLGYHYRKQGEFVTGDINYDSVVDGNDMLVFLANWLSLDCGLPSYCNGADLNTDFVVNIRDLSIMNGSYGTGDITAPVPNPSGWAITPRSISTSSVYMKAQRSYDNSGRIVLYQFRQTNPDGSKVLTTWDDDPNFTAQGLQSGTEYGYEVRAWDGKVLANTTTPDPNNVTAWSTPVIYVITGEDKSAPLPDPAQWAQPPHSLTNTSISMTAATATDPSNVWYKFTCTTGNGASSIWQRGASFLVTGLTQGATYGYTVQTKDDLDNFGTASPVAYVTLGSDPNTPVPTTNPRTPCIETYRATGSTYTFTVRRVFTDTNNNVLVGPVKYTIKATGAGSSGTPIEVAYAPADTNPTFTMSVVGGSGAYAASWHVMATDEFTNLPSGWSSGTSIDVLRVIFYGDCF